jgi:hypothetical protein
LSEDVSSRTWPDIDALGGILSLTGMPQPTTSGFFFAIKVAIIRIPLPDNPTILAGHVAARDL